MSNLGKENIGKLLFNLATPAIIAQIVNILYNIVDRIFIGRMDNGEIAMAGIGISFPIIILITAFSSLFGMGGAPLSAINMGAKKYDKAEEIMGNSFSMLIILGILLTSLFFVYGKDILWLFGASNTTFGYAWDYLSIYLIGTTFTMISIGMNPFINTQGFARIGMCTILIGAAINIVLDPIFIFLLDMGIKGAALATIIAQGISALWVMNFITGHRSKLKLKKEYMLSSRKIIFSITALGASPFIMQSTECLVLISLNSQLYRFGGDMAVSAMTIMTSIMQIAFMPLQGLGQGLQPIVSFNYGAGNLNRVRETIKLSLKVGLTFNITFVVLLLIFPSIFVKIFNDSPTLIETTSRFIRIYFIGFTIFGAQNILQQTFVSLGRAKTSIFIACLRKLVLLVPLIYMIPCITDNKVWGVLIAEPISDITSVTATVVIFTYYYNKHLKK